MKFRPGDRVEITIPKDCPQYRDGVRVINLTVTNVDKTRVYFGDHTWCWRKDCNKSWIRKI